MARQAEPMGSSFVAELSRRLQGQGPVVAQALGWIDARLADQGSSIGQMVADERDAMAADGTRVAHTLASLRLLGGIDWRLLLEGASTVEPILRADPIRAGALASKYRGDSRDRLVGLSWRSANPTLGAAKSLDARIGELKEGAHG